MAKRYYIVCAFYFCLFNLSVDAKFGKGRQEGSCTVMPWFRKFTRCTSLAHNKQHLSKFLFAHSFKGTSACDLTAVHMAVACPSSL